MMAVVTGGASSGKSAFAERLALSLPGPHAYVATMRHGDGETEARIARHRQMRAGKGFVTVELAGEPGTAVAPDGGLPTAARRDGSWPSPSFNPPAQAADPRPGSRPSQAHLQACNTALLEDLGNLVANGLVEELGDVLAFPNVVVVANEVGCDGVRYDDFTMEYIRTLGGLACRLAARADVVIEVVAGVPHVVKGEVPWIC